MKFRNALCIALLYALPVSSQTLSVADIMAQVDQKVSGVNEYQQLLNDPDPVRAIAAMEIMLASGDPDLRKMAIEYGFFSPSRDVRAAALKTVWDSNPLFSITFDGTASDVKEFSNELSSGFRARPGADGVAKVSQSISGFDEDDECYAVPRGSNLTGTCVLKVFGDEAQFYNRFGNWYPLTLTEEGVLEGVIGLQDAQNISIRIEVE